MEDEEDNSPPFWLQNTTTGSSRLRRSYSMFLNSSAVLVFILVAALALVLIIAPTLHSFTSHILKPQSVKKSWDSLNLVLVLFAILCGFLGRNNNNTNETPRSYQNQSFIETPQEYEKQNPETMLHWYDYGYSDRTEYYRPYNRLRSISSYPDLRQDSPWLDAEERWRFYDDTHVNRFRQHRRLEEEEEGIIKSIKVDTFEVRTKEVPKVPPIPEEEQQPLPLPPSPPPRRKDHPRNAGMIKKQTNKKLGAETLTPRNSMLEPPPPPPLPENKSKRGSATKEFLTSFKGKKKRQRQRSVENFESVLLNSQPPPPTTLLSRQPPPLPPPPSVFHSLFSSKKSRHKKDHYDPRPSPRVSSSKTKPHVANANLKPRLRENSYALENNVIAGNESPLIPIPPPPPPPFKLPAWKFKVQGDFVRIDSISSSSSESSPELDVVEDSHSPTSEAAPNGGGEILLFYPSPNVDTKADSFIEKFRTGLRTEKISSTVEKQGTGMSNLGSLPSSQKTGSNKLKTHN